MKIDKIGLLQFNKYNQTFKGKEDDEMVYIPLVWDEKDTFTSRPTTLYNEERQANEQKSSKFKKIRNVVAGTTATVALVPAGIEKTASIVDSTLRNTSDSVKSSMETVAEIKSQAKELFGKKQENSQVEGEFGSPMEGNLVSDNADDIVIAQDEIEDSDDSDSSDSGNFDMDYDNIC